MTQEELARKGEIPYATLMKIESDSVKNPTINTIKKLATALGISTSFLVDDMIPTTDIASPLGITNKHLDQLTHEYDLHATDETESRMPITDVIAITKITKYEKELTGNVNTKEIIKLLLNYKGHSIVQLETALRKYGLSEKEIQNLVAIT